MQRRAYPQKFWVVIAEKNLLRRGLGGKSREEPTHKRIGWSKQRRTYSEEVWVVKAEKSLLRRGLGDNSRKEPTQKRIGR